MSDQKQAEKPQDEIVGEFEMRRSEIASIFEKMQELDSDRLEHELVLKTLNKLEPERRCFRLVNNVLVERTVAEVLPAVTANSDKINELISTLGGKLKTKEDELAKFKAEHNIVVRGEDVPNQTA
ncbi:Prefoldin subunit 2 [Plasmodiophora brassicae]|uniref:Prefoldin subunit 2 n=1 Tax=Plasmodiophora brassicae TaxID=37360 RepID=A0A0G4IPH8_PLABS|nr:hypothetical protein PBRA_005678 [Plasmodiophora brassicae]